jgi:predicted transcriptional regulator
MTLNAEIEAKLLDYAERHGLTDLDSALAELLNKAQAEYEAELQSALAEGSADVDAGRVIPAEQVFEEIRIEYGLPRGYFEEGQ